MSSILDKMFSKHDLVSRGIDQQHLTKQPASRQVFTGNKAQRSEPFQ